MNQNMKKYLLNSTLLVIFLTLLACNESADTSIKDESKVLATVGDFHITEDYLTAFLNSRGVDQVEDQQQNKQLRSQGLDVLVKQVSLAHQAEKAGYQLTQQHAFEIQQAKQRALAQIAIEKHLSANPVTTADVEAEYQRTSEALKGEEYHVHHLLYADETEALDVLDQIKTSDNYLAAEADYLLAHPNVKNVGDIGWINIMQVPEVFRKPLQVMPINSTHPQTLVSQYGVHILYLEAKRPLVAPELETVEAGIRQSLRQQKIDRYQQLAVIKAKAKIVN